MSAARDVIDAIGRHGPVAVAIAYGYALGGAGRRIELPGGTPVVEKERRNSAGRCTLARFRYKDGSRLEFRWSERNGARYREVTA